MVRMVVDLNIQQVSQSLNHISQLELLVHIFKLKLQLELHLHYTIIVQTTLVWVIAHKLFHQLQNNQNLIHKLMRL